MKEVAIIGVDLAVCVVAMEACATAHRWARTLAAFGHEACLIAPKFVKPYLKSQKNDMADAEAIAEAASRPSSSWFAQADRAIRGIVRMRRTRFVEVKTPAQQGLA